MIACKICLNETGNKLHTAQEMAFGFGGQFNYLECGECGCLQLVDIPKDMAKYYPQNYYSLQEHDTLKTFIRRKWSAHAYGRKNLIGRLFTEVFFDHRGMRAVRRADPAKTARILDVGCGHGHLLQDLAWLGFKDLTGVDPYLDHDLVLECGVKIFKRQLSEMPGHFDLIMLNHSFEHMEQPAEVMMQLAERLSPDGQIILGIPVASSFAWRHYGVNWANLDAPRHFFLHTFNSIKLLTKKAGLRVEKTVHEGTDEQFWLSEQYAKGIPANRPGSMASSMRYRLAAWRQVRECRAKATALNRRGEGDLVCFHLRMPG